MTQVQGVWLAIIALFALVNAPFLLHLLTHRNSTMDVSPAAQAIIDSLTAANTSLSAALAGASTTASEQLTTDLGAIKTAADTLVASIDAAIPPTAQ